MQYLRGWRAMTSDPDWVGKISIASLLVFCGLVVPIVGPMLLQLVLAGWSALMLRRAVSGQDSPLPRLDFDFDYLGKLVTVGFKAWLAAMIWRMPLVVFAMASICCLYAAMGGMMFSMAAGAAGAAGGSEAGGILGGLGGLGSVCLMVGFVTIYPLCMWVLQMPLHIALIRTELSDDVNQAMRFKDVLQMTRGLFWELAIGQFVMGMITFGIVLVGELALCIGLFPAVVVVNILMTYWHAEIYKVYLEKGGEPLPIGPLSVEGGDPATVQQPGQQQGWNRPEQF